MDVRAISIRHFHEVRMPMVLDVVDCIVFQTRGPPLTWIAQCGNVAVFVLAAVCNLAIGHDFLVLLLSIATLAEAETSIREFAD